MSFDSKSILALSGRLLMLTGDIAMQIRMNSPYNSRYDHRDKQHGVNVLFLSDLLHHFETLGRAIGYAEHEPEKSCVLVDLVQGAFAQYREPFDGKPPAVEIFRAQGIDLDYVDDLLAHFAASLEGSLQHTGSGLH